MAAENQHYVPQFILRQFLSVPDKEQVSVYDKHSDRTFTTSVRNVMAERRFNDFDFEDMIVSFEPIACRIEDISLPAYKKVIESRMLDNSPEDRAALGFLIAFQLVRTKAFRDQFKSITELVEGKASSIGIAIQDMEGYEPPTEEVIKKQHLMMIQDLIGTFAGDIATKIMFLVEPPSGRSFYLGDNPVSMHNLRVFEHIGNIGVAVPGIEIYMPLSSNLLLCAYCPTVISDMHAHLTKARQEAFSQVMSGRLNPHYFNTEFARATSNARRLSTAIDTGTPLQADDSNMDFYNSLQTAFAFRYIICQASDFNLARKFNKERPEMRRGRWLDLR
jgi:hypothetical protein